MSSSIRCHRTRALLVAVALIGGCQAENRLAPNLPPPGPPPGIAPYAFYLDIDVEHGLVRVVPPAASSTAGRNGMAYSLAGAELVGVTTSNFFRSAVGQFVANKRTITFDIALTNKLSVTDLITPTFPVLPIGTQGILAFPYTVAATSVQGGTAVPNTAWNGTGAPGSGKPVNFFNDFGTCGTAVTSDCYRWEMFPAPLLPGQTTAAQKVGFTVDRYVTNVGVYLVVAADLLDHPPPPPLPGQGAILGAVSSSLLGAIGGTTVTVSPGGATATTDGAGKYVITSLAVGPITVAVSNLPAGCTVPSPFAATVTSGGITTVDIAVTCAPAGTVAGTVTSPELGPLSGVVVSAGVLSATTDPSGAYSIANVLAGTVSVTVGSLPASCPVPSAQSVDVAAGAVATADFTINCGVGFITGMAHDGVDPIVGATVTAGGLTEVTDQFGVFTFSDVPAGTVSVSFTGSLNPGCNPVPPQTVDVPVGGTVSILFRPVCTILHVTASATGSFLPITGSAVVGNVTRQLGQFGNTTFSGLPFGITTVSLSGLPTGCTAPTPVQLDLQLPDPLTGAPQVNFSVDCAVSSPIRGQVTLSSGLPYSHIGAQVTVDGINGPLVQPDGSYQILPQLPGNHMIAIVGTAPLGCSLAQGQNVVVPSDGSPVTLDFVLTCQTGTLTGTVSDFLTGQPLANVTVRDGRQGSLVTTTDANGLYTLLLPVGIADIGVFAANGCTSFRSIFIVDNTTTTQDFSLLCSP